MGYESKTELQARLAKVDAALDKARVSIQTSVGDSAVRKNYEMLLQERKEIVSELSAISQSEESSQFGRTYAKTGRLL